MKRYYAHFFYLDSTIIQNHIIEIDSQTGNIISIFPFVKEISHTEFYSGTLYIIPLQETYDKDKYKKHSKSSVNLNEEHPDLIFNKNLRYKIYHEDSLIFLPKQN